MGWKQYREGLSYGGELFVNPESWGIHYYFPGIDLRHNGESKNIAENEVSKYIQDWRTALAKAKELVKIIPAGGSYRTSVGGIEISIGGGKYFLGYNWRMKLSSEGEVEKLISEYEDCIKKADEIQSLLKNI